MITEDLEERLVYQLARIRAARIEGREVKEFRVWNSRDLPSGLNPVRIEKNTYSWGSCTSETCNHNSHDPYMEGDSVYIDCRPIGKDEDGNEMFETETGFVFAYRNKKENGYHFAPTMRILEPSIT